MIRHRLYKKEKLCSIAAIESLFSPTETKAGGNNSIMAYPWRAVWRINEHRHISCPQFLIIVPKKRLRKAVDRVTMRRRMREAYRLNKEQMPETGKPIDIAFIYVANTLTGYKSAVRSIHKFITSISAEINNNTEPEC